LACDGHGGGMEQIHELPRELPAVRPVPLPFTTSVAGVSFRQGAVARCYPGEMVSCRWVPQEADGCACEIRGDDARLLGYVPAALAPRVVARAGDSVLIGHIEAVVGERTTGLRVKLVSRQD
jgi:hypothetical protein